ncbi:hypothetical protein [Teichococcus vastitatis]|uniref:Uncharacterized protein n=1 Tax=Teichococcus vastitatis TaxID=2307076 RepID=A0ABS9W7D3_9PROT|nr:hypothetical protein [Pseudoroseomonas vastitatis]MCI0754825.1 hypothetical protein [Pseudoroseomonas vastitatis]
MHFGRNAAAHAGKTQSRIVSAWIGTAWALLQAALTWLTKLFTSPVSCSDWRDNSPAAASTCEAAAPVSLAFWLTPAMLRQPTRGGGFLS